MPADSIRSKTDSVELFRPAASEPLKRAQRSAHYDHTLSSGTTSATLKLRASPTTPARDDVHEHDQGDDDHRRDGDDGDGGHGEDHARVLSRNSPAKPLSGDWYGPRSGAPARRAGGRRANVGAVRIWHECWLPTGKHTSERVSAAQSLHWPLPSGEQVAGAHLDDPSSAPSANETGSSPAPPTNGVLPPLIPP